MGAGNRYYNRSSQKNFNYKEISEQFEEYKHDKIVSLLNDTTKILQRASYSPTQALTEIKALCQPQLQFSFLSANSTLDHLLN